jgi:hypothetical protein
MMKLPTKQTGMTAISMLLLLIIAGFFALLVMKMGPVYLENYKVKTVLSALESESMIGKKSISEVRKLIDRRLYINEVRRLSMKDIKVKKADGKLRVEIIYEVREHIAANVDAVMSFEDIVEVPIH